MLNMNDGGRQKMGRGMGWWGEYNQMWEWVKAEHEKQQKEWEQREGERFRERSMERTRKHSSVSVHQERFQENRRLWIQCGATIVVFTLERWIVVTILCPWDVNYKRWHTPTNPNINLNHQYELKTPHYQCLHMSVLLQTQTKFHSIFNTQSSYETVRKCVKQSCKVLTLTRFSRIVFRQMAHSPRACKTEK